MPAQNLFATTLTNINFFKVPIRLKIGKQDFFSSRAGEVFSMAIYIYLIYSLAISDVFYKESPKVVQQDGELPTAPWYNFTETNFFFGLEIADGNGIGLPYDETIFSVMANYFTYGINMTSGSQIILSYEKASMVLCKDSAVDKVLPELIEEYPMALCLPYLRFPIGGEAIQSSVLLK